MTREIASKLPNIGTTIFTVMSNLANEHGAINLAQGFPDFEPPQLLRDRVAHHLNAGHNQYAPMPGVPELREQVAVQFEIAYGVALDADSQITVTSGATEALFSTIAALAGAGDEVIVFDPAYDSYAPAVTLAGARCVHVPLAADTFRIDFARLEPALSAATRLVVINTPHNPTGAVFTHADLDKLADLLDPYDCFLLSDEVYASIVLEGDAHVSAAAHPRLAERSIAVFSFGKTYHATGWKVGYCIAPAAITAEIRKVHQFNTFTTPTPLQYGLADFMRLEPGFAAGIAPFYRAKRDLFAAMLHNTPFAFQPCAGTYFQIADYSGMSDLPDTEFARWLTTRIGVAVIPISVFCAAPSERKLIRFCFAKEDQTLHEAVERLCKI